MSKELKALKRIIKMYENFVKTYRKLEPNLMICEIEDFTLIKAALKDYELLCQLWNCKDSDTMLIQTTKAIHDENNKKLKALEIIKECFNLSVEKDNNEFYIVVDNAYCVQLKNKQQYNLVKEVLL